MHRSVRFISILVLSLLYPPLSLAEVVQYTVSTEESPQPPTFAGLDLALKATKSQSAIALFLINSLSVFTVSSFAKIETSVEIEGNGQIIVMEETISVANGGLFSVRHAVFRMRESLNDAKAVFEVVGTVLIEECLIQGFVDAAFALAGTLQVHHSTIENNTATIVSIERAATLIVNGVDFNNNREGFVSTIPTLAAEISIQVSQCVFRNHTVTDASGLFSLAGIRVSGDLSIVASKFVLNVSPLFYFDVSSFSAVFDTSEFTGNSYTLMTLYAHDSVIEMRTCNWTLNSGLMFEIKQLQGDVIVTNSTVSQQRTNGLILISNNLSTAGCHFSMVDSHIFDICYSVDYISPGVITSTSCLVLISHSEIRNVNISTTLYSAESQTLMHFLGGQLTLANVSMVDSGSSGWVSLNLQTIVQIFDTRIDRPIAGQNVYIVLLLGSTYIRNLTILPSPEIWGLQGSGPPDLMCIASSLTSGKMEHLTFRPSSISSFLGIPLTIMWSTYVIDDFDLDSVGMSSFLGIHGSEGNFSHMRLRNCSVNVFMIQFVGKSTVHLANLTVTDLWMNNPLRGLFGISNSSLLIAENLYFDRVNTSSIFASRIGAIDVTNITVKNSFLDYLLYYPIESSIILRRLRYTQSSGGLMYLLESSVICDNSLIENVTSSGMFIGGLTANMTFTESRLSNIRTIKSLGKLQEGSVLTFNRSQCSDLHSSDSEGFRVVEGTIAVLQSKFRSFGMSLFQGIRSSVLIQDSAFADGRNAVFSLKSKIAYGGVLGCVDCPAISISRTTVFNVTSRVGGAVAVRKQSNDENSNVHIANSDFFLCKASTGGAIHIHNSTFVISETRFQSNSAELTGGAVDVSIRKSDSGLFHSCVFVRNNATEAGAIKWHNAPISAINSTFLDNNATYGPDIASYGVEISSRLTHLSGREVSGAPLDLVFELLDHYGHRVTTAFNKMLKLTTTWNVSFRGNEVAMINEGVFNFSDLTIYAPPNSSQAIIGTFQDVQGDFALDLIGEVTVTFRTCNVGEIRRNDRCEYCYSGNVSFSTEDMQCRYCPNYAFCPGGRELIVDPYYWRSQWNSTTLFRCPLEDNCEGGANSSCAIGTTGPLCNECAEDYYRFRTVECESCGSVSALWVQVLIVTVLFLSFVFGVLKYAVRKPNFVKLYVLKTMLHHAQFLSAMSPLKMTFPSIVRNSLHGVTYVSSLLIADLPLSCFGSSAPEYARALIASLLLPVLTILFLLLCIASTHSWKRNTIVLTTSALLFTPIVALSMLVPLFACQKADTDTEWLFLDMSQQCWTGAHLAFLYYLFVPSLILNVVAPLVAILIIAFRYQSWFEEYFPMWRCGYKLQAWDTLLFFAKATLFCVLLTALSSNKLSQLSDGLVVLTVLCVINVGFHPCAFVNEKYFHVSEASLVIVSVSMGLNSYYIYNIPEDGATDYAVSGLFAVLNGGFFAACGYLLISNPQFVVRRASVLQSAIRMEADLLVRVPQNSFDEIAKARLNPIV